MKVTLPTGSKAGTSQAQQIVIPEGKNFTHGCKTVQLGLKCTKLQGAIAAFYNCSFGF